MGLVPPGWMGYQPSSRFPRKISFPVLIFRSKSPRTFLVFLCAGLLFSSRLQSANVRFSIGEHANRRRRFIVSHTASRRRDVAVDNENCRTAHLIGERVSRNPNSIFGDSLPGFSSTLSRPNHRENKPSTRHECDVKLDVKSFSCSSPRGELVFLRRIWYNCYVRFTIGNLCSCTHRKWL